MQMRHLRIIIVSNETLKLTFRCKIMCSYFQTDGLPQPVTRPGQSRHLSLKAQSLCGNGYRLPSQPVMSFISYTEIPYHAGTSQIKFLIHIFSESFFHFSFYNKCHGEHDLSHDFLFRVPPFSSLSPCGRESKVCCVSSREEVRSVSVGHTRCEPRQTN